MRTINLEKLQSSWGNILLEHKNSAIPTAKLQKLCKENNISLSSYWIKAYKKVGILSDGIQRGNTYISTCTIQQLKKADEYRQSFLNSDKKESLDSTLLEYAKVLKENGWFVHKPSKGEQITITKTLRY